MAEFTKDGDVIVRIADRWALQQSWWIASEIARRNGELLISRVEDDAHNPLLIVHDGPMGPRVQIDLPAGPGWESADGDFERLSWLDVFENLESHAAVKLIEERSRLTRPARFVATNRRTIVYRLAAKILATKLDDRHSWQIVPAPVLAGDADAASTRAVFARFPTTTARVDEFLAAVRELQDAADAAAGTCYVHEPFWVVLRDLDAVLVLDEAGYVHLPRGGRIDLLPLYRELGSDITALTGVALMPPRKAFGVSMMLDRGKARK